MTITNEHNKNPGYFEQDAGWISPSTEIKKCKNCSFTPSIFSLREKEINETSPGYASVKLLGMKIICNKCKKFITKYHNNRHTTLHPDDSTIKIVVEEWNKIN